MATTPAVTSERGFAAEYARHEERILARDQIAASQVLYGLLKQGRPVTEIVGETVRIHAPYTHVPYHQRLDDGVVKFVNNDHCLLSERVCLPLMSLVRPELRLLPLTQTVWYMPTGLDPWNQLLGRAPGHYTRLYDIAVSQAPPTPEVHWPDQAPLPVEGSLRERLNHWLTLVQRGEVLTSYRVFLGLMQDVPNRRHVLAHLAFAGLIDVQNLLDGRDQELLRQDTPLTPAEEAMLVDVIMRQREFSVIDALVALLKAGRSARSILDAIQIAAAQVILETGEPNNYSMAQHGYEFCNTVGWFYDAFEHPHRLKILFVAALFINRGSEHQANTPGNSRRTIAPPAGSEAWSSRQLLEKLEQALLALRAEESVDLTAAYLKGGYARAPLVQTLATAACKIGNDPHNQELGLCTLEDYLHTKSHDRDRLLLASAQHTAGHRKYGDPLEAYRRFAEAMELDER